MGCNSMFSSCNLCFIKSARVLKICIRDNYHLLNEAGLFKYLKICNQFSCCRLLICESCLLKFGILEKLLLECLDENKYHLNSYHRMQDLPSPIEEVPENHSPKNNCSCDNCRSKFSGLSLLADVVEHVERRKSSELITSVVQEKTVRQTSETINEPSTSTGFRGKISPKSVKTMKCEFCEKTFTHRGDLNKHLRSHTGEQPFECPVCKRRFTHTSNLARHLRVHSGDRPFHCDRCNRDFGRKDKLIMHQKTKLCMKASQKQSQKE